MTDVLHPTTATTLALIITVVIPLVSSALGKARWPGEVLGVLTLALSAVNGFVTEWANSSGATHYEWKNALALTVLSFVLAVAARYGLWKNTATDARLLNLGGKKDEVKADNSMDTLGITDSDVLSDDGYQPEHAG